MKFLCVPCDEQMKLKHAIGPEGGAVAMVYACPSCSAETAMLTNPHETQVVQSLGVRIGPGAGAEAAASKCPFTGMLAEMGASAARTEPAAGAASAGGGNGTGGGGAASDDASGIPWTAEARERMANVPDIVRTSAVAGIEKFALDHGYEEVDAAVLERARTFFGIA